MDWRACGRERSGQTQLQVCRVDGPGTPLPGLLLRASLQPRPGPVPAACPHPSDLGIPQSVLGRAAGPPGGAETGSWGGERCRARELGAPSPSLCPSFHHSDKTLGFFSPRRGERMEGPVSRPRPFLAGGGVHSGSWRPWPPLAEHLQAVLPGSRIRRPYWYGAHGDIPSPSLSSGTIQHVGPGHAICHHQAVRGLRPRGLRGPRVLWSRARLCSRDAGRNASAVLVFTASLPWRSELPSPSPPSCLSPFLSYIHPGESSLPSAGLEAWCSSFPSRSRQGRAAPVPAPARTSAKRGYLPAGTRDSGPRRVCLAPAWGLEWTASGLRSRFPDESGPSQLLPVGPVGPHCGVTVR